MTKKILIISILLLGISLLPSPNPANAFVQENQYSYSSPAGFLSGIWHGLLSPYSLIARWFISDVIMYATPNTGWLYDAGFLIGVGMSFPVGWIAAIISVGEHVSL